MEALERFFALTRPSSIAMGGDRGTACAEACLCLARVGDWLGAVCEAVQAADAGGGWKDLPGYVYAAQEEAQARLCRANGVAGAPAYPKG